MPMNLDLLKRAGRRLSGQPRHSFAANVFYSVSGKAINVVAIPVFNIFTANYLGAERFGQFAIALVYLAFAQMLTDFGMSTYITKETATEPRRCPPLFAAALIVNLTGSLLYGLAIGLYELYADVSAYVTILAAGLFFLTLMKTVEAVAAGRQRFDLQIIPSAARNVMLLVVVAVALLLSQRRVDLFPYLVLAAWFLSSLLAVTIVYKALIGNIRWPTMARFFESLLKSLPFLLLPVLSTLYYKNGVWLLSKLQGLHQAGVFQASYGVVEWVIAAPAILAGILLPTAAAAFHSHPDGYREKLQTYLSYIIRVAPVLCVLGFALATVVLSRYTPEFTASCRYGVILSLMIVPISLSYFMSTLLIASEQRRIVIRALVIVAAVNVAANLFFIPRYGIMAAAVAVILCEWLNVGLLAIGFRIWFSREVFNRLLRSLLMFDILFVMFLFLAWQYLHGLLSLLAVLMYVLADIRSFFTIFAEDEKTVPV